MEIASKIKRSFRKNKMAFLFLAPALALNFTFFLYPLIRTIWMSFYKWTVLGNSKFIGMENYDKLMSDPQFWQSFKNIVIYTIMVTPMIFMVAFVLAIMLNRKFKGVNFFRSVYFLPVTFSFVVASLIWMWMYNEMYGIINFLFKYVGLIDQPVAWLGKTWLARISVSIMIVWKTAGFSMVLLLAGLQGIPESIYEAASIDGASGIKKFMYVTFPILKPTFALALLISFIGSFLAFDHFYVMTGGGPANTTQTVVMYIFKTSFNFFKLGYGASISIFLLIILVILSFGQIKLMNADKVD
jgi:multiple sugar transport system permease protein